VFKQIKKQVSENKPTGRPLLKDLSRPVFNIMLYTTEILSREKFKEIPDVLGDKKNEVSQYIKSNNLSGKTDDDYRTVFNYYNGLK